MKKGLVLVGAAIVAAVVAWILWPGGGPAPVRTLAPITFGYVVNSPNSSISWFTWSSNGKPIPPVAPLFASLRTKPTAEDALPALPRTMLAYIGQRIPILGKQRVSQAAGER